ncbi:MAG: hypothetical protein LBV67_00555 [Streptococcaceae bacterium]|jgi:hypothetical protein|nr:hypothetical protein [Streptococcaceae bacterium]
MKERAKTILLIMVMLLGMILPLLSSVVVHAVAPTLPDADGKQTFIFHKVNYATPVINTGEQLIFDDNLYLAGAQFSAYDITALFEAIKLGDVIIDNSVFPAVVSLPVGAKTPITDSDTIYKKLDAYVGQFASAAEMDADLEDKLSADTWKSVHKGTTADTVALEDDKSAFLTLDTKVGGKQAAYVFFETKLPDKDADDNDIVEEDVLKAIPMVVILPILKTGTSDIKKDGVHIYPKNEISVPTKKLVDETQRASKGVSVGEIVDWELTVTIPSLFAKTFKIGNTEYFAYNTIGIIDEMKDNLEFIEWVSIDDGVSPVEAISTIPMGGSKNLDDAFGGFFKVEELSAVIIGTHWHTLVISPIKASVPITTSKGEFDLYEATEAEKDYRKKLIGKKVTIIIRTRALQEEVGVPIENKYHPEFKNNHHELFPHIVLDEDKDDVQTYGYRFRKHDASTLAGLAGATFGIKANPTVPAPPSTETRALPVHNFAGQLDNGFIGFAYDGTRYLVATKEQVEAYLDAIANNQAWKDWKAGMPGAPKPASPEEVFFELKADPELLIAGLEVGSYKIFEIAPPTGYVLSSALKGGLVFNVTKTSYGNSDFGSPTILATDTYHNLLNEKGGNLPNTGGVGLIYIVIAVVTLFAAMFGFNMLKEKIQTSQEKHSDDI